MEEPYQESIFYTAGGWHYGLQDRTDDAQLQKAVARIEMDYPMTAGEQVGSYAWALYGICLDREMFDPELIPVSATGYSDNIWFLSFIPAEYVGSYYDGPQAHFLISGEDGHIIHYSIDK